MDTFPTNGPTSISMVIGRWVQIYLYSSSSLFPTATYIIIKHNTIQHNLQNTAWTYIYINQICVGKGVKRSVILIHGSPQPEDIINKKCKIIDANVNIITTLLGNTHNFRSTCNFSNSSSQWHAFAPYDLLKLVGCSWVVKSLARHIDVVATVHPYLLSVLWACQGDRRCFNERRRHTLQANDEDDNEQASLTWTQDTHNAHIFPSGHTQWTIELEH